MAITPLTGGRPHILKRAYYRLAGIDPARQTVRRQLIEVIKHFRFDKRPSLCGKIPGLTPALEQTLESGTVRIVKWPDGDYLVFQTPKGNGTKNTTRIVTPLSAYEQLLPEQNKNGERAAYLAAEKWEEDAHVYPGTNMPAARKAFKKKIEAPYGIKVGGVRSAGVLYLLIDILNLLPKRILKSGALMHIGLGGPCECPAYFGDFTRGRIGITSSIDRYLFVSFLLHELGHVVHHFLIKEGRESEIKNLHHRFWNAKAVFATSYLSFSKTLREDYQRNECEFIAENFFHFIIFGKEMLKGPNRELRQELYQLFAGLYKEPHFDALDKLAP